MKFLLPIFLLISFSVKSQTINAFINIPSGIGAEYNWFKADSVKWTAAVGVEAFFLDQLEIAAYVKGQYNIVPFLNITGLIGIHDFKRLAMGLGARGLLPISPKHNFLIEPMWHSEGSRINLGIQFKL